MAIQFVCDRLRPRVEGKVPLLYGEGRIESYPGSGLEASWELVCAIRSCELE